MAKITLYTTHYDSPNQDRQKELDECLRINKSLMDVSLLEGEPTYAQMFKAANLGINDSNDISVIANSDIYFEECSLRVIERRIANNECWALTRWEMRPDGIPVLSQSDASQDVWIFRGEINIPAYCNFPRGRLGCDNRIAHELKEVGYKISNPCFTIRTYHLHNSQFRLASSDDRLRIPEPYLFLNRTSLA